MKDTEFQLRGLSDPRLAVHATSPHPAWLWSTDGSRILWANPVGARLFGQTNGAVLAEKVFGPADSHRRQVMHLARRLRSPDAVRMERLRGFGAPLGGLVTCGCVRLDFTEAGDGILVVAAEMVGRTMPLVERLQALIEGFDTPIAAFTREGLCVGTSEAARALPGLHDLSQAGLEAARRDALKLGRSEASTNDGRLVLQRVGTGADIGLVALITFKAVKTSRNAVAEAPDVMTGPAHEVSPPAAGPPGRDPLNEPAPNALFEISSPTDLETSVETPKETTDETPEQPSGNVLPFRPPGEPKSPALTALENHAFDELARQLSARLENENNGTAEAASHHPAETGPEPSAAPEAPAQASDPPGWLSPSEPPARGESRRDKMLLDLLPVGVLIYRLDRMLYANPAFLQRIGYHDLHALEEAGGLDALYVEPGVSTASSTSDTGTPVMISAPHPSPERAPSPTEARLFTISWDEESALALIFSNTQAEGADVAAAIAHTLPAPIPSEVGHANAEELGAILDIAAEGVVMFDVEGAIHACNRSTEALFGYDGAELVARNLADLFAPESQRVIKTYLESVKDAGVESLLDHGREALGRVRGGGLIPLSVTMGRTRPDGPNFFAVFRDLSQAKKSEGELRAARRLADRSANAKADLLARISHEVRTPLNAIIGFAEVMIGERFGTLGNERYLEYMKDIRASGERVIAIIDELLDLSRIETGRLDLAFVQQNLNELVESCVALMQPQANRAHIIVRTSLAPTLPPVVADARALRQITLNLIGNSIHLANAGGQVIVSTALSDFGEVILRVRDTGHGLNDHEVAAAMEPFRTQAPSDQTSDSSGVSLSLTKALVEANRARFHIKTARSGTLIEVAFSNAAIVKA
jgi:PAS domain S-box-containing protein